MQEPKPGEKYVHFKGKERIYEIICVANDCETPSSKIIVYKQLYEAKKFQNGTIWTRSLEDFCGDKEFPDKTKVKRFVLLE